MKIVKKLFSFICFLFAALMCFSSSNLAFYDTPLKDGEQICFQTKAASGSYLAHPGTVRAGQLCVGAEKDAWFTVGAKDRPNVYRFMAGKIGRIGDLIRGGAPLVLNGDTVDARVIVFDAHDGRNEDFMLERAEDGWYRIKDLNSRDYVTVDPTTGKVWMYHYWESEHQLWRIVRNEETKKC